MQEEAARAANRAGRLCWCLAARSFLSQKEAKELVSTYLYRSTHRFGAQLVYEWRHWQINI
jgi:hypothetical protein